MSWTRSVTPARIVLPSQREAAGTQGFATSSARKPRQAVFSEPRHRRRASEGNQACINHERPRAALMERRYRNAPSSVP